MIYCILFVNYCIVLNTFNFAELDTKTRAVSLSLDNTRLYAIPSLARWLFLELGSGGGCGRHHSSHVQVRGRTLVCKPSRTHELLCDHHQSPAHIFRGFLLKVKISFRQESTITVLGSATRLRPCIFAIWCKLNKFNVIDELWVEAFNFQGSLLWSITHTTWEYVSVPRNQTQTTKIEIQSSFSWSWSGHLDYML